MSPWQTISGTPQDYLGMAREDACVHPYRQPKCTLEMSAPGNTAVIWGSYSKSMSSETPPPPRGWFQVNEQVAGNPHIIRQFSNVLFFACACDVCECVCVYACGYTYTCVCESQRLTLGVFLHYSSLYLVRQWLTEPRTHRFPVSPPKCWEDEWISMLVWRLWLFCGLWGSEHWASHLHSKRIIH